MQYKFEIISNYFFTQNFVCFGCVFHTVIQNDSHSLVNTNGINQIQIGSWYWLKYYDVHGSPYQCTSLIIIIQNLILFLRLQFQIIKYLTQALAVPCMRCLSVIRWLKKQREKNNQSELSNRYIQFSTRLRALRQGCSNS